MDELFNEQATKIMIYIAKEEIEDELEGNKLLTYLPYIPIKAIVSDLNFSSLQWKCPGLMTDKAKELIIEKKHKTLIEKSYKIKIVSEDFEGWRVGGKLSYKEEGNFLRVYAHIRKLN